MEKINILIKDFCLFQNTIKSTSKIVESAKFELSEIGLSIYGIAKDGIVRSEITTNSIYSNKPTSFIIENLNNFVKILQTVIDIHENDFSELTFTYENPYIKFNSPKFKTRLTTCNEGEKVQKWLSKKITAEFTSVFDFTTTSDLIKRVNSHSYIFENSSDIRVYLELKDDMENNAIYATIGNKENNLNNEMTFKFGLVNFGKFDKGSQIILDLDRINLFNVINSQDIKISLMNIGILVTTINVVGKNDSFLKIKLYTSPLKN